MQLSEEELRYLEGVLNEMNQMDQYRMIWTITNLIMFVLSLFLSSFTIYLVLSRSRGSLSAYKGLLSLMVSQSTACSLFMSICFPILLYPPSSAPSSLLVLMDVDSMTSTFIPVRLISAIGAAIMTTSMSNIPLLFLYYYTSVCHPTRKELLATRSVAGFVILYQGINFVGTALAVHSMFVSFPAGSAQSPRPFSLSRLDPPSLFAIFILVVGGSIHITISVVCGRKAYSRLLSISSSRSISSSLSILHLFVLLSFLIILTTSTPALLISASLILDISPRLAILSNLIQWYIFSTLPVAINLILLFFIKQFRISMFQLLRIIPKTSSTIVSIATNRKNTVLA